MTAITVVVPTYERPELLAEAIRSLQFQTFSDWVAVVVDGSTEPWKEAGCDPRVRYYRESEHGISGVAEARNFAVRAIDSELIAYLDDDEIYYPTKLEVMYNHLRHETEAEFAYHDVVVSCVRSTPSGYRHIAVPRRHWHPEGDPNETIHEHMFIAGLQVMHTRRLFEATGGFIGDDARGLFQGAHRAADRYDEDADFFRRCARYSSLSHLPLQLAEYRVHGGNANHWGIDYQEVVRTGRLVKEFY